MTNQTLNVINSNPNLVAQALSTVYNGKVFAVVSNERVDGFYKTKRGAEGYIKREGKVSYYNDDTQDMVTCGYGLAVVEIAASDIVDPVSDMKIWYTYLQETYYTGWNVNDVLALAKRMNVNTDIIAYLEKAVNEAMTEGTFTEIESLEEGYTIEEETVEEVVSEQPEAQVIDMTARFQQKKEDNLKENFFNQFTNEMLPSLTFEEKTKLADVALQDQQAFSELITDLYLNWKTKQVVESL